MNAVSARNQLNGQVPEIGAGSAESLVTGDGFHLTSAITSQAVQDLGLKRTIRSWTW
ncbi:MAG: TOBE domain-containing protein [Nitrospira sp.]